MIPLGLIAIGAGMLALGRKLKGNTGTEEKKKGKIMTTQDLKALLLKNGFPAANINLFVAQALIESPGLASEVALLNNNLTGIQYESISPKGFANSEPGTPIPAREGKAHYAKFPSYDDWAKCYKGFMQYAGTLSAVNAYDFAGRLKKAGYYVGNPALSDAQNITNYASGMQSYLNQLT